MSSDVRDDPQSAGTADLVSASGLCPQQGVTVDCDRRPGHDAAHYDAGIGVYWWHDSSPPRDVDWWREYVVPDESGDADDG